MAVDPDPGVPIASGRAAEVFDLGDGTVLRRYRRDHDVEREARLMRWLADAGVRVPAVHAAEGRDLVMERIEGPTMLEDLEHRPWMILRQGRLLAELQRDLASLVAPDWVRHDPRVPDGPSVLHLDLHPMNVLLAPDGPVLIDWTNAGRGDPLFDAAVTVAVMSSFEVHHPRDVVARRLLVGAFARRRGRRALRAHLGAACELRMQDPAVTDAERAQLDRLRSRSPSPSPSR